VYEGLSYDTGDGAIYYKAATRAELDVLAKQCGDTIDPTTVKKMTQPPPSSNTFSPVASSLPLHLHHDYVGEAKHKGHVMAEFLNALYKQVPNGMDFSDWVQELEGFKLLGSKFTDQDLKKPAGTLKGDPRVKEVIDKFDPLFSGKVACWPDKGDLAREEKIIRLLHALRNGVKYVDDSSTRAKYKVTLGPTLQRRNENFDTARLSKHFSDKQNYSLGQVIWVLGQDGEFYSHICKIGRIHHSSFMGGGDIDAAGDWVVVDGKLKSINGQSGHYKPGMGPFEKALAKLKSKNVFSDNDPVIQVWDNDYVGQQKLLTYTEFQKQKFLTVPYAKQREDFFQ
jgi:hypothetical protein